MTNVTQAGVAGLGDSIGAFERNHAWISSMATHQFGYCQLMNGVHERVGEGNKADEIISIDVLHEVDKLLDRE